MGFQCGLVGLPNVGKSTLFNALTRSRAANAANYPFCTIDPNIGRVEVPDPRLTQLADLVNPQKITPASVQFVDIAGLVAGASQGEGLGNRFLAHLREVDAIAHVVRAFTDREIQHVADTINPADDIATINTELLLADLQSAEKAQARAEKNSKTGDKSQRALADLLTRVTAHLAEGAPLRALSLPEDQTAALKPYCFLTQKPILYIANVDEPDTAAQSKNAHLQAITQAAQAENAQQVIPICATLEQEISELPPEDAAQFLADAGLTEAGLDRLIRAGYALLGLHTYFTAGEKEVRAWTLPIGASAEQAAAIIHTDFAKGFIRAESISFADYLAHHGEAGAKQAGKMRLEGRDYIVQDGDVMHFRFNV